MTHWRQPVGLMLIIASGLISGCSRQAAGSPKPTPPATVAHPIKENELNTVVLTSEAESRLGLSTAEVERRSVPRFRSYGGEVVLPASALLTVSAPVNGTLQIVKGQELPQVGTSVREGQPMFALVPHVLTQSERVSLGQARLQLAQLQIDAERDVKQAQVQVDAAQINYDRADQLVRSQAGTKKDRDDADAMLQTAKKSIEAALLRKKLVDSVELDTEAGALKALIIPAPRKGIVRATYAVPGEMVPAGSALFEIMNTDSVWIKVPVYVGELGEIADEQPAQVKNLADLPGAPGVLVKPVLAPPTALATASAVDLYYELPNSEGKYRPGQRVSVLLAVKGEAKSLGLPWPAVVHDIYGGTWVYVQTAPRTFARQRVQVRYVNGDWAVLAEGPAVGAKVVTAGAAEVFGTEFGFGK